MEVALPLAGIGFALGWPIEWTVQRFPLGLGTPASRRRRLGVAAVTAALFALLAWRIGLHAQLVPALVLTALVVPASVIDLEHRIIPDRINLPGAALVFACAVAAQPDRALELALGGLGAFAFLWVAWFLYPAGMGRGDVKMALMIGLALGRYAFVGLFAGFLLSSALGVALLAGRGLGARKTTIPFGPFLAFGAVVGLLFGEPLTRAFFG